MHSASSALLDMTPPEGARVAIVGACGGLGRALTSACLALGHRVAALDLPQAHERAPVLGALPVHCDATAHASTEAAFEQVRAAWQGLDHLAFLVGLATIPPTMLKDLTVDEWDRVIAGNLRSAFLAAKCAVPLLDDATSPSMVFVSSAMTLVPQKGWGAYVSSKLGVAGLVKSLGIELAPHVRVNAVAPSAMLTPFMSGGPTGDGRSSTGWFDPQAAAAAMPMQRLCTADDVVGPILFLASPAARFVSGQTLHVSGARVLP